MGERGSRNVSIEGRLRDIEDRLIRIEEGQLRIESGQREVKQMGHSATEVLAWRKRRKDGE